MLETSFTTLSAKNLSLFVDVGDNAEVGVGGGDCANETIKRLLPMSKNLNKVDYLIFDARVAFT